MLFSNAHKKILSGSLFLSIVFVMAMMPIFSSVAHAQETPEPEAETQDSQSLSLIEQEETLRQAHKVDVTDFGCFEQKSIGINSFAGCAALASYYLMLKPAYIIAGWVSILFNIAFFKLVVGMGQTVNSMTGITAAWITLRDIGNIFLVFLLVYVGISTILGISGYGYKRLLWKILVAALLVNFSITFTKLIIDVSNLAAIEMYDTFIQDAGYAGMTTAECLEADNQALGEDEDIGDNDCVGNGLAGVFWTQLHVTQVFRGDSVTQASGDNKNTEDYWNMVWASMLGAVMFIILAFVFGATAFFLMARFVILVFLIIISPVALIAGITGVSRSGRSWLQSLINQSVFAPLILLMWWVAYTVLETIASDQPLGGANVVDPSNISTAMTFIIVSGFLIAGLIVAKHFGAHGANAAISTGSKWSKAVVYGGAGWVGANTAGRWSHNALNANQKAYARRFEKDEDGNYVDNTAMGRFARTGFAKKVNRGMQNVASAGANKKFLKTKSFADRKKAKGDVVEKQKKDIETTNRREQISSAVKKGDTESANVLRKATINEIRQNADDLKKNPKAARHLSQSTYKKLKENKDDKFTENELREFDKHRDEHFMNLAGSDLSQEINKASPKELAEHDVKFLRRDEVIDNLDTQTLAGMHKSGLSKEKRQAIKEKVEERYKKISGGASGGSSLLRPDGRPVDPSADSASLSREDQNIVKLHKWLNDDNKMAV